MEKACWKEAVVYQIYPRSFKDSNGDGIGDLRGIIEKLDYLRDLGVSAVWLSPVYKSPNDDNGYDISDYCDIMDEFGTMADWEELRDGLHARGIKLIMDLVVNHTSDEHPWFQASRSSKDNPCRDFYYWRPGKPDGREPNNWLSFFGGSAWQYDEATGEYYLHLFSRKQPDLNWENPKVRREVYKMMRWWLDRGVDGFRMDVINCISKTDGLPDAGDGRYAWGGGHFLNGPKVHEFLREMHREVLSRYDVFTVGETPGVTVEEARKYTDPRRNELNMVFQFEHMGLDSGPGGKWDVRPWDFVELKRIMNKWQTGLKGAGWNSLYLSNHDQPRMVSRFGDEGKFRKESAKMLATMLHTMQGTPFIYQGEEIGMTNARFESIDDYRDIETLNMYREKVLEQGEDPRKVMQIIHDIGRDNARTPMQWDDSPHAGFTTGTPWIKVNPNYNAINVKEAMADPDSIFHYYRKLIALRNRNDIMVYGDFVPLMEDHPQIYAYLRVLDKKRWLVLLNFFGTECEFELPQEADCGEAALIIGNYADGGPPLRRRVVLRPYEARVYALA